MVILHFWLVNPIKSHQNSIKTPLHLELPLHLEVCQLERSYRVNVMEGDVASHFELPGWCHWWLRHPGSNLTQILSFATGKPMVWEKLWKHLETIQFHAMPYNAIQCHTIYTVTCLKRKYLGRKQENCSIILGACSITIFNKQHSNMHHTQVITNYIKLLIYALRYIHVHR